MNKDQVKGTAKEAAGKVHPQGGKARASSEQPDKGPFREAESKTEHVVGDPRKSVKDASRKP